DHRLRGRAEDEGLLEVLPTAFRHQLELGSEAFNVLAFLLEEAQRDQRGEIPILVPSLLDQTGERIANVLPDRVTGGAEDHRSGDGRVVRQLGFADHVVVPAREIHRLFADLLDEPSLLLLLDRHVASEYKGTVLAG